MGIEKFEYFINNQDFTLKTKGPNPRFIDQKCTPDVLSHIASIVNLLKEDSFTVNSVWEHPKFRELTKEYFNKPDTKKKSASSEYDKFIAQNLNLLSYSGILAKESSTKPQSYTICNQELLVYIGQSDKNSFHFLYSYLNKFIKDNKLTDMFNCFFDTQDNNSTEKLIREFIKFMQMNTQIGQKDSSGSLEIRRILPKIVNVLAVHKSKKGFIKGKISNSFYQYKDLMYNRENFRDNKKNKEVTRQEYSENTLHSSTKNFPDQYATDKKIQDAKAIIKKLHRNSEVKDRLGGPTTHVHHIFPKSAFPRLSAYTENLIALTAGQHLDLAHSNSNTNRIDMDYQRICLLEKKGTIKNHLSKGYSDYSKEKFIYVINNGFNYCGNDDELNSHSSFEEIEEAIIKYYINIL